MRARQLLVWIPTTTLAIAACSGGGGDATRPTPTIGVASSPITLTLAAGAGGAVAISVTRAGGYTGAVSLSLEGAPNGINGTFDPATLAGAASASTLTLTSTAAATAGAHTLTIRATGGGVQDRTATLALTVTPAPSFTLGLASGSLQVERGSSGATDVTIARTNFPGSIALSVTGAPAGVVAGITPLSTTGTTAAVSVMAGAGAALGQHTLTVRAQAQGLAERAATLQLTIVATAPLTLATPTDAGFVVGTEGELTLEASGPGPRAFESIGAPLPGGLMLDAATGEIRGTPTVSALLAGTPAGDWPGVVIRVSNGLETATTDPFTIAVTGAPLPAPYAYMPFDEGSVDDTFGRTGTRIGNVVTGQVGAIGGAVFVGGANSFVRWASSLSAQLNGKAGFTIATTLKTTSAGTMLFNLSDLNTHYTRVYLGMAGGRVELGGRSRNRDAEAFRSLIGDAPVNDGAFHTVVGVMDLAGDRASLYRDGMPDGTRTMGFGATTYETFTPADQNVLGHVTTLADSPVAPNVVHDELALWDVALDATQAATVSWLVRRGRTLRDWIGF